VFKAGHQQTEKEFNMFDILKGLFLLGVQMGAILGAVWAITGTINYFVYTTICAQDKDNPYRNEGRGLIVALGPLGTAMIIIINVIYGFIVLCTRIANLRLYSPKF
jgi:hypothetical protein